MEAQNDLNQVPVTLDQDIINTKLVHALKQVQLDRIRVECEMNKKLFDVEYEYSAKLAEFDEKRRKITTGEYAPTDEETKYEFADPETPVVDTKEVGIAQFWPQIFHNVDLLAEMVTPSDEPLLEHLIDVRTVLFNEPRGYRLEFEFSPNNYFSNKVLTKEYFFSETFDPSDPLSYESMSISSTKGCEITWTDGDRTMRKVSKKLKNKKNNQVTTQDRMVKADSFFNFFDPPAGKIEEVDEETKELLAADFDIAETLRLNVIPRAVLFYTGEAIEDDDFDEAMDEDLEFDEDDDEDDDDLDLDDSNQAKAKPKSGKGRGNANAKKEVPPECKQQ